MTDEEFAARLSLAGNTAYLWLLRVEARGHAGLEDARSEGNGTIEALSMQPLARSTRLPTEPTQVYAILDNLSTQTLKAQPFA